MIVSGALDRFPKLQIIIGHMGEALPFWMYRLDFMHQAGVRAGRYASSGPLNKEFVSNYLKENFVITNSGVAWEPAIKFTQDVIGKDRVMYAMDYPYQCPAYEVDCARQDGHEPRGQEGLLPDQRRARVQAVTMKILPGTGRGTARSAVEGAPGKRCIQPPVPSTTAFGGGPPPRAGED
jgi:predicted TIM-barrel fold metal-dependent hydrolase